MSDDFQIPVKDKNLKVFENQMVEFFEELAGMLNLNMKFTTIFAYFKIYEKLTQEQLKILTGFSSSTISTTLQSLIQLDVLSREVIGNTRKNIYTLIKDKVTFIYTPFRGLLDNFENLDLEIQEIQLELKKLPLNEEPSKQFLNKRLNSIRNFIEAQRRAIDGKSKFRFFDEDISSIVENKQGLNYSKNIQLLEDRIIQKMIETDLFYSDDPIQNKTLGYFVTRYKCDQELLEKITGFSRSTISRNLTILSKKGYIRRGVRGYQKSRIYYVDSVALCLIHEILNSDYFIFSKMESLEHSLLELQNNTILQRNKEANQFLQNKFKDLINQIDEFKHGSQLLDHAKKELEQFLIEK
ncbi:MAG: hypothetical protein FK734_20625 [Asgard group archaeon]|nr:hypothetical protein [Asgard group archaeon]